MKFVTPTVRARRLVRKMRGGAQAHLIEADDHCYYVVKLRNNPQGCRILVNELVSSLLLREMRIATPKVAYVEIDDAFLSAYPEAFLTARGRAVTQPATGLHFGSHYPGVPGAAAIYDFLPDLLLRRLYNRSDFLGALVFDKWISNGDGRQAIFFRARVDSDAGDPNIQWVALVIDNGCAFQGVDWTFRDSAVQGVYARPAIYGRPASMLQLWPWIDAVADLRREVLDDVMAAIPPAWIAGEECALERLLNQLYERRALVPALVRDSLGWMRDRLKARLDGRVRACRETGSRTPGGGRALTAARVSDPSW